MNNTYFQKNHPATFIYFFLFLNDMIIIDYVGNIEKLMFLLFTTTTTPSTTTY